MALILRGALKLYYYLNEEIADERTQNWPLMRTPWPGIGLLVFYLMVVLKWLPKYMEDRPAHNLRKVIAVYNAVQIFCCAYVLYQGLRLGWLNHYSLVCQPLDYGPQADEYAWKVCYAYFLIKLADLFDTVFFVLRKKQNQVSFLHVYHHFGMVAVAWGMVKWLPGGHTSLLVVVNSFVHIIMYMYYLLTVWDDSYKQSLWWKKHVTQVQILQFSILLLHFCVLVAVNECRFPRQPAYILIPQNLFMVILFSDFYYRTYIKASKPSKDK
ncbi:very long chain fatty acid elongase 7-like [Maniola hyperantus]|uniref:very long chain fatty acid elongase 7-like n=1 Tax=Aphantopus hyperantus TaxID=2795564 RepID=UPI001569C86A|nr:elongation of very long chain fatty acids protein 4-like [Maniola hyperantus]XP_034834118.1 elongation of very long chain fatty acids protein 4-like [Maniola hyperantus]